MSEFFWLSTGNLGSLICGETSELSVQLSTSSYNLSYQVMTGTIPPGLELIRDGSITGTVAFTTATTSTVYSFNVGAVDVYGTVATATNVSITINQTTSTAFTTMYCRPYLALTKRAEFNTFITDPEIFQPDLLYRPLDPNFGIQSEIKMVIDFGIERLTTAEYYEILARNFYKRRFLLGPVAVATALNDDRSTRYEIIYLPVLDKYTNSAGETISSEFTLNGITYYPAGVTNMRSRIRSQAETTDNLDPKFTKFLQPDLTVQTRYMKFVPLCYTLPGKSNIIVRRIANSGFQFNLIDFEVDRVVVQNSIDNIGAKYLLLNRNYPLM